MDVAGDYHIKQNPEAQKGQCFMFPFICSSYIFEDTYTLCVWMCTLRRKKSLWTVNKREHKYTPIKPWVMGKDKMMGVLYKQVKSQTEKKSLLGHLFNWILGRQKKDSSMKKIEIKFKSLKIEEGSLKLSPC